MTAIVIDGSKIAQELQVEITKEVEDFKNATGITPCLYVVLVGDDPRSLVYIRKKREACEKVGIMFRLYHCYTGDDPLLNWDDPQLILEGDILEMNANKFIHGLLVQLPLPPIFNEFRIFDLIDPRKDVDVLNPENVGLLLQGRPRLKPCTPSGIVEMLRRSGITLPGKKVVVINRSNVVGKPLSSMLIQDCDEY